MKICGEERPGGPAISHEYLVTRLNCLVLTNRRQGCAVVRLHDGVSVTLDIPDRNVCLDVVEEENT